jgi:DNA-binding NarL/FixJ family response regulator
MVGAALETWFGSMEKLRVLLVDDHAVVRRGLRKILESVQAIDVVGEAGDASDAVAAASRLRPDVVVMDVGLPGVNGIDATQQILAALPSARVLMLSMHTDEQYVQRSLAAGAKGYLLKDADDQQLVSAIRAVGRGESFFNDTSRTASAPQDGHPPHILSGRERAVLSLIGTGHTNREVATALGVSLNTVETHRKHIIAKLDLHSTADLVRYALRHGIVGRSGLPG